MVMCVRVDIAPGMYPVRVLMVCSLCYIVVPTIWGGPPRHCAQLVHICTSGCIVVHICSYVSV